MILLPQGKAFGINQWNTTCFPLEQASWLFMAKISHLVDKAGNFWVLTTFFFLSDVFCELFASNNPQCMEIRPNLSDDDEDHWSIYVYKSYD